jgi:anthranilate/para-aminobenzoate synthase component I
MKTKESNLWGYLEKAGKEGFCVLHSAGVLPSEKQTIIGVEATQKIDHIPATPRLQGYIGHLSYPNPTLKNRIPDMRFYGYEELFILKNAMRRRREVLSEVEGSAPSAHNHFTTKGPLQQSVTKRQYLQNIKAIKDLLAAGEIYQLNFAIRFQKQFEGDPYALFLKMIEASPTDFSAFLNCGDYQILSASPERFFTVKNHQIITQPIKGTVSKKGGKQALNRFLHSEKERAELDMITDLERNDVGKICKYGSLRLVKEREIIELPNLWHAYSEVRGALPTSITPKQIIEAMFPGGSITGCPKIRAMEYIEKLEGMPRNIFTGSIGYIANGCSNGKMDFNISIRTALIHNGIIEFWAGGGIVADSDPEKEYEECLLKAERFLSIL